MKNFKYKKLSWEPLRNATTSPSCQPIKTKASTLAGFGWSTVDYEMASSSFAYCRDASVLKYELSLKLFRNCLRDEPHTSIKKSPCRCVQIKKISLCALSNRDLMQLSSVEKLTAAQTVQQESIGATRVPVLSGVEGSSAARISGSTKYSAHYEIRRSRFAGAADL
jgi:hypothetical protein